MDDSTSPARRRTTRRRLIAQLGADQARMVSRRQLLEAGVGRHELQAELDAARWQAVGRESVCLHTGPVEAEALWWAAVFEGGPRAFLDGESSLVAGGLEHYRTTAVRVSVPRGARIRRIEGLSLPVEVRQTRRWAPEDVTPAGIPRSRNPIAAVRGALWARTNRQAAYLLTLTVQQGLSTAEELGVQMLRVRRDRRRSFIHDVLLDLIGGVRSMGELDFARECRARGLPEPERQVVRRGRDGRYYLDVSWEQWGVVVEIDGVHHTWASTVVADALRQNSVAMGGSLVLRLPLLGLRVAPEEFFAQITRSGPRCRPRWPPCRGWRTSAGWC